MKTCQCPPRSNEKHLCYKNHSYKFYYNYFNQSPYLIIAFYGVDNNLEILCKSKNDIVCTNIQKLKQLFLVAVNFILHQVAINSYTIIVLSKSNYGN